MFSNATQGWRLDIPVGEKMFKWWDPVFYWYRYILSFLYHVSTLFYW